MQGFYNITEQIRLQLAQDEFVNTITYGDIFRVDLKKQTIFPLSHVVVNNATMEKNIIRYSISVMAMDIVDISKDAIDNTALGQYRGNDNEQDVLNTQQAVLLRLLKVLEGGSLHEALYQLDGNPSLEPFTERFENYLAGWVATFDVLIPNDMTACDGSTVPSCADASYLVEYANGTLIEQGTVASGGSVTVTVPNPSTCDDATLTVNGTSVTTIPSGDTFNLIVHNSLGNQYGVGSLLSGDWQVGDSQIVYNGQYAGNLPAQVPLQTTIANTLGTALGTVNAIDYVEIPDTTYNVYVATVLQATTTVPTLENETINITWV